MLPTDGEELSQGLTACGHPADDLLPNFKGGGFLSLRRKGVEAGVAVVPAKVLGGFNAQIKGFIVGSVNQEHLRTKDQQLGDLGGRSSPGGKDDGLGADGSAHPGQGGPALPVEAATVTSAPICGHGATTMALALSLKDAVGLGLSSLIQSCARPSF